MTEAAAAARTGSGARWVPAYYSAVLTLAILAPLLAPGHLLLRDAVSTPRSHLTDTALGLGDAAPRAVPQDAALAVLTAVVDGGPVVDLVLLLAVWAAGTGAAALARRLLHAPLGAQLVAVTLAIWNPYVAERLLQGHWSLLTGYAALPWTVLAAHRLRTRRPGDPRAGAWGALALCLAAAGLTPTGALLAGTLAVLTVGPRRIPATVALWLGTAAPWLVATALSGSGGEPSDPAGVAAFAARAEPHLGTLGTLAGLGGIWNGDAVPATRTGPLAALGTALLLALVLIGLRALLRPAPEHATTVVRRTLVAVAAAAVVLPALAATPWGIAAGEQLVTAVPGAGLLRDTQKYVALAMPAYLTAAAAGVVALGALLRQRAVVVAAAIALLVLPLADLAWGVGGALRPVRYPDGWPRVAALVAEGQGGDVAVLPGGMFRRFAWSGSAPVLDPAPRMLPADVLQTGELPVRGGTVAGEGARAARVEAALLAGAPPAAVAGLGVGWILVEHGTPGPLGDSADTLATLGPPLYADADLALYRVPDPIPAAAPSAAARRVAGLAHLLWAALLLGGAALAAVARFRR